MEESILHAAPALRQLRPAYLVLAAAIRYSIPLLSCHQRSRRVLEIENRLERQRQRAFHLTRRLFGSMLRRIEALPWPTG